MTLRVPSVFEFKSVPSADVLTQIGSVDENCAFATVQIVAVNDGPNNAVVKIAISSAMTPGAVERADYIDTGDIVEVNGRISLFNILVPANRRFYAKSNSGNVIFRVVGLAQPN